MADSITITNSTAIEDESETTLSPHEQVSVSADTTVGAVFVPSFPGNVVRVDTLKSETYGYRDNKCDSALYELCRIAGNDSTGWDAVRAWMLAASQDEESSLTSSPSRFRAAALYKHSSELSSFKHAKMDNDSCVRRAVGGGTALHEACKNASFPLDVVKLFIQIAPETMQWANDEGQLPLHVACQNSMSTACILALARGFPLGKIGADIRGYTPLHCALAELSDPGPELIALLASNISSLELKETSSSVETAALVAEKKGFLPLHIACGASLSGTVANKDVLEALRHAYPRAMNAHDSRGRTPFHILLGNAPHRNAPVSVLWYLGHQPRLLHTETDCQSTSGVISKIKTPLLSLVNCMNALTTSSPKLPCGGRDKEKATRFLNTLHCMGHVFQSAPDDSLFLCLSVLHLKARKQGHRMTCNSLCPNSDSYWRNQAVLHPAMQKMMNARISQRLPTAVLMMDFYVLIMILVAYHLNVITSIDLRFSNESAQLHETQALNSTSGMDSLQLVPLYIGGGYFLVREILSVIGLWTLQPPHKKTIGRAHGLNFLYAIQINWLNAIFTVTLLFWTVAMDTGWGAADTFRTGTAISALVLWIRFLAYLRNILIAWTIFSHSLLYVVHAFAMFYVLLGIVLVAFSQIFYTLYLGTDYCEQDEQDLLSAEEVLVGIKWDGLDARPFCNRWTAFLHVLTMLLKRTVLLNDEDSAVGIFFLVIFMLLVVLILGVLLFAVSQQAFRIVVDRGAACLFWGQRCKLLVELDAATKLLWKGSTRQQHSTLRESWNWLEFFLNDDDDGFNCVSWDCFCRILWRGVAYIAIPLWICVGACTAGLLWPPQVREAVFTCPTFNVASSCEKHENIRYYAVAAMDHEINSLKEESDKELAVNREQFLMLKSTVFERKIEVADHVREMKQMMTKLIAQGQNSKL